MLNPVLDTGSKYRVDPVTSKATQVFPETLLHTRGNDRHDQSSSILQSCNTLHARPVNVKVHKSSKGDVHPAKALVTLLNYQSCLIAVLLTPHNLLSFSWES